MVVLLLVVLQLAGPDSDCTKGRRPNLDEGGRLATPKMDGFGVGGLGVGRTLAHALLNNAHSAREDAPLFVAEDRSIGHF